MGSNSIEPFSRQSSDGLGWVDQWDYKYNDSTELEQKKEPVSKKEKMAEVSKKAKAAASTGYAKAKVGASKAKVGASVAATKMSAGVGWIKQQGVRLGGFFMTCWGCSRSRKRTLWDD